MSLNSPNKIDLVSDHKCITFDTPLLPTKITQKPPPLASLMSSPQPCFLDWPIAFLTSLILITKLVGLMICVHQPLTFPLHTLLGCVPIINTTPWINDNIRKQSKGRPNVDGKNLNRLHIKELLFKLNQFIKDAGAAYFSGLINCNKHKKSFLFTTINQLVNLLFLPFPPHLMNEHFESLLLARSMACGSIFC